MKISTMLDLFDSCDKESELIAAHKLVSAESRLIAIKSPEAMRPLEYIVCSWAFRYLCYSVQHAGISH